MRSLEELDSVIEKGEPVTNNELLSLALESVREDLDAVEESNEQLQNEMIGYISEPKEGYPSVIVMAAVGDQTISKIGLKLQELFEKLNKA